MHVQCVNMWVCVRVHNLCVNKFIYKYVYVYVRTHKYVCMDE